jgi:hypothetical protein
MAQASSGIVSVAVALQTGHVMVEFRTTVMP